MSFVIFIIEALLFGMGLALITLFAIKIIYWLCKLGLTKLYNCAKDLFPSDDNDIQSDTLPSS